MLIIFFINYSCNTDNYDLPVVEDCEHYDFADCNTTEPAEASVFLHFTINPQNSFVIFNIYDGYTDDNNLLFIDTSWDAQIEYILPTNHYYSVKAEYHVDGNTIKVIDGGEIKTMSSNVCDSICWAVNNLDLNLSLQ